VQLFVQLPRTREAFRVDHLLALHRPRKCHARQLPATDRTGDGEARYAAGPGAVSGRSRATSARGVPLQLVTGLGISPRGHKTPQPAGRSMLEPAPPFEIHTSRIEACLRLGPVGDLDPWPALNDPLARLRAVKPAVRRGLSAAVPPRQPGADECAHGDARRGLRPELPRGTPQRSIETKTITKQVKSLASAAP
jgi:hypothetical protein